MREGQRDPEFYTLPVEVIRRLHQKTASGWDRVLTKGLDLSPYHNAQGFEQIARDLGITYPGMESG